MTLTDDTAMDRERNRVPVIERMMDMLELIARRPDGLTIRELTETLEMPRSTVYRILSTLEPRGVVHRGSSGAYVLGAKLVELAGRVADGAGYDLVEIASPHLEKLSAELGEACKISVRDGDAVLVLATRSGSHAYGLTIAPGRKLPLHAGAASKVLMAHLEPQEIERLLRLELHAFTPRTITDPKKLRTELARIRREGWSFDKGEYSHLVRAYAAPVVDPHARVIAAVSIPFLNDKEPDRQEVIRQGVIRTAKAISEALPALDSKR